MKGCYYKFDEALRIMKNSESAKSKTNHKSGGANKRKLEVVDIGLANKNL